MIATPRLIGAALFALYLLAFLIPESLWGFHYIYFAPGVLKVVLLALAGTLLIFPKQVKIPVKLERLFSTKDGEAKLLWLPLLLFIVVALYHSFPILLDEYGDAFQYRGRLETVPSKLPEKFYQELFSASFLPSMGRKTILYIYGLIAYSNNYTYQEVFKWAGLLFGLGYAIVWIGFVRYYLTNYKWQLLMMVAGLFAPFTQIFYGHNETYAPVFFMLISWLVLLVIQHKRKSGLLLSVLLVLLLISARLHPFCLLLFPAWILSLVQFYKHKKSGSNITYRTSQLWFVAPIFLVGAVLYFFVLKDYNDPRFLDDVKDIDRLFLPILSPEYPLNNYNLLGWNHILDFVNVIFSWSSAAWLLLLSLPLLF
ncbi:MAG: hypothetical protein ACPG5W_08040, partial [Flavobacteriales bacterium]